MRLLIPILTRRRSLILTRIPTRIRSGRRAGYDDSGRRQKPNTDKDADKNAGKDKNQSIAATGASIVPVGVLAVSMMAAGCALTGRKRRES